MNEFRYSICKPTNPNIIEKGKIDSREIMNIFHNFPWKKHLDNAEKSDNIYYSPSLEFENISNKNGLAISAVGNPENFEFYVFFKRPKMKKTWFGLSEKMDNNYTSELLNLTKNTTIEILQALTDNRLNFLEQKFK